ncbi:hypothetical protein BY458DRAFT_520784 [Sporodiniella umbellata]|nr:hypothetical protein BY458DRAFT_520784 [Sporodiniella umbellata]
MENNHTTDIPSFNTSLLQYIPANEHDFQQPSRTSLYGLTVAEWAGKKLKRHNVKSNVAKEDNWKDVYRNIKCMDQLYDASFYSWLKSEENVLVTAMYLHRIANEYPLERIVNALKWLISDWRLESISTLVRYVTVDWCDQAGDLRRAHLLRHLTYSWATQYTTTLITMVLSSAPYASSNTVERERFLRAFTQGWDFSKLSEFFMYLQSPANIDYKLKCIMLQEAARKEREELGAKLYKKKKEESDRRHHRRTSSNDVNDIKRLRLSTPELEEQQPSQPQAQPIQTQAPQLPSPQDICHTCTTACKHTHSLIASSPPPSSSSNSHLIGSQAASGSTHYSLSHPAHGLASTAPTGTSGSSTQDTTNDVFLSLHGFTHMRRRSSSVCSNDSNDLMEDAMDTTTESAMKKKEWDRVF